MNNQLRTIRLYGKLGAKYGRVHQLAVRNAREAVRALCVLFPGFEQELRGAHARGVAYSVFIGKENIGREKLEFPPGREDIRIAPVLTGSKRGGVLQTIVGIVLVVVGAFTSWAGGGVLISVGVSMIAGGVTQMLSPQPKGLSAKDSAANSSSYNFNGPVNTSAQGRPVGLLYGLMIVGSAIIYGGIFTQDQL